MPSISYFKQVQHSVAVLFFSSLFQYIFARYVGKNLVAVDVAVRLRGWEPPQHNKYDEVRGDGLHVGSHGLIMTHEHSWLERSCRSFNTRIHKMTVGHNDNGEIPLSVI